ncbi:hypothetical protein KII95_08585 [Leuconostoc gelidum subsp. aenigmaticum]|uniref:hypothetical protein n=1 Tax=Leuconostoc gelidum TaxID=1244 RepID=UPI001CC76978|nr:hypothetical protein [Leuconostoc gelidum]MBZ6004064.1 hypothetical protein [Leuconostoc gelidum subsp. aenigmaticum]
MITENIIQAFAVGGGFGYLNILTLEQLGVQTFDGKSNKDRNIMLFSFSAFNYLCYQYFQNFAITFCFSFLITVLAILMLIVGYPLMRYGYEHITTHINLFKKIEFSQTDPWDEFIKHVSQTDVSTYVFSLEDKFISGGQMAGASNGLQDRELFLNPYSNDSRWNIRSKEELDFFVKNYQLTITVQIFVDFERKIKFYAINESK